MVKAVIPVAGVGSRLRPHTHTQPKPLIPVAGKPILGHIIENLLEIGITDFVFIIGYLGEKIEDFVREKYADKIRAEFVVQSPRKGLGHAIYVAKEQIQDSDEVLIFLGDTIFEVDLKLFLEGDHNLVAVQEVEDPRNFGVAKVDKDGFVLSVVEKPNIPKSNLGLVGLYMIREVDLLIKALEELLAGDGNGMGEYHLPDALMKMLSYGAKIGTVRVDNWFDCGKKETLLETNRILLERVGAYTDYKFKDTVIIQPVHIELGCSIENSIIGPYVAIDENATIVNSIVTNSILGAYSELDSIVLSGSVIGTDASLKGKAHSVNIGDNTQIDFND